MQNTVRAMLTAVSSAVLMGSIAVISIGNASADETADIAEGKKLSFDRKKGNCIACHVMAGGEMPGNIGPPLLVMKDRFPDRDVLKSQIFDARIKNPNTIMPPFGAHEVLSKDELEKVVTYIHSL